jgi:hypothetical protein
MRFKYEKDPYMINSATRIYVVNDLASKQKIGVITFLNIVHEHKRVEIGGKPDDRDQMSKYIFIFLFRHLVYSSIP